eukprot:1161847-Pelagomonas_calceolata.AAC.6
MKVCGSANCLIACLPAEEERGSIWPQLAFKLSLPLSSLASFAKLMRKDKESSVGCQGGCKGVRCSFPYTGLRRLRTG